MSKRKNNTTKQQKLSSNTILELQDLSVNLYSILKLDLLLLDDTLHVLFSTTTNTDNANIEDIDLNFVRCSFSNNKLVNVVFGLSTTINNASTNTVYFADIERSNAFDTNEVYNKNSILSVSNISSLLIHNICRSDECFFKSAIYQSSKSDRSNNTYDYQNIFTHKLGANTLLSNVILTDNVMYALQPMSPYGRYAIDCDIYSWISVDNGYIVPPDRNISTVIYNKDEIKKALTNDDLTTLQSKAVLSNLTNIEYNMLYEIPGNSYNDFESGNIAANSYKCKNAFNSEYNMSCSTNYSMWHARNYLNVGNCNKQVYLTYKDNIWYNKNNIKETSTQLYNLKCEQVELLGSMNRYANLNGHKSNVYSIATYTDVFNKINDTTDNGKRIKNALKNEVNHAIYDIVAALTPVNTLILSAYINELK